MNEPAAGLTDLGFFEQPYWTDFDSVFIKSLLTDKCGWVKRYHAVHGLLRFDLSGTPAGAEILSASLNVYAQSKLTPSPRLGLYPLLTVFSSLKVAVEGLVRWIRFAAIPFLSPSLRLVEGSGGRAKASNLPRKDPA